MANNNAVPFFKSVGSKIKLVNSIANLLPGPIDTYYEPFVGTGAVLFELARRNYFKTARIYDVNPFVTACFREVKRDPRNVRDLINQWSPFDRDSFEEAKTALQIPTGVIGFKPGDRKVAAFLFVSLCCFAGNLRWNKNGVCTSQWSEPQTENWMQRELAFGRLSFENLNRIKKILRNVTIDGCDNNIFPGREFTHFSEMILDAQPGDFVFCDPPYIKNTGLYIGQKFSLDNAQILSDACKSASERGVRVVIAEEKNQLCDELFNWAQKVDVARDNIAARRFFKTGAKPKVEETFYVSPGLINQGERHE